VLPPDSATSHVYTLSLHDALPISKRLDPGLQILLHIANTALRRDHYLAQLQRPGTVGSPLDRCIQGFAAELPGDAQGRLPVRQRSEEHTSELQSRENLVCRLLLEK